MRWLAAGRLAGRGTEMAIDLTHSVIRGRTGGAAGNHACSVIY